jgi:hypothetical protein
MNQRAKTGEEKSIFRFLLFAVLISLRANDRLDANEVAE